MLRTRMADFQARGLVHRETLRVDVACGLVRVTGQVACVGRLLLDVNKTLAVVEGAGLRALVLPVRYAYNASVQEHGNVLRYDNVHAHAGHPNAHHRHDFDWRTGLERHGSPTWVGEHGAPTLSSFVEEVEVWYWEHRGELPDPDGFAQLSAPQD